MNREPRPPARPVEGVLAGLVVGLVALAVVSLALHLHAVGWKSVTTHAGAWAATTINFWLDRGGVAPLGVVVGEAPWASQNAAFRELMGWRIFAAGVAGLIAGTIAGIGFGSPPPAVWHVGGRRVTESPRRFRRALARREPLDGVPLHPAVRISRERERSHALLIAGTGAGKTQVILPLIAAAGKRGDRRLIYDFKGDLTETHYAPDVALLAPWDARGTAWDVARDVGDLAAARELAAALVPEPPSGNPMWSSGARQILTGLIVAQQARAPGAWSVAELARDASGTAEQIGVILQRHHPEAASLLAAGSGNATVASFQSNLTASLAGLHDLARAWGRTGAPRWSVRDWLDGRGPATVIVQGNTAAASTSGLLIRMIFRLILQRIGDPSFSSAEYPTWLFLDEFLQAGRVEPLLNVAETARSKNVRLVLAAQNFSRIRDLYGRDNADALAGTVGTILVGRSTGETAEWASRLAGQQIVRRYSRSITGRTDGDGSFTDTWQRQDEPVLRPAEFSSRLGTVGHGRRIRNRLVVLAGGDTLGLLSWPLTVPPRIAPAHVPVPASPVKIARTTATAGAEGDSPRDVLRRRRAAAQQAAHEQSQQE